MKFPSLFKISLMALSIGLVACGGDDDDDGGGSSNGCDEVGSGYESEDQCPEATPTPAPTQAPGATPPPSGNDEPLTVNFDEVDGTAIGTVHSVSGSVTVLNSSGELVNSNMSGRTLYIFGSDSVDTASTCTSTNCVNSWPPLIAAENDTADGPYSKIARDDGNMQWALRGMPLYFFIGDNSEGDINGIVESDGVLKDNPWYAAVDEPVMQATDNGEGVYLAASGKTLVSTGSDGNFSAGLRNWAGWTLYTRTADPSGESTCQAACLEAWPALLVEEGDEDLISQPYSIVDRTLGENGPAAKQLAYHGKPLYFRLADGRAGEFNDSAAWPLARPVSVKASVVSGDTILTAAGLTLMGTQNGVAAMPADGRTLYTQDNGAGCPGGCLDNWPALVAPEGAEDFTPVEGMAFTVVNTNGVDQWALNGEPLYFFAADNGPGSTAGDNVDNWSLVNLGEDDGGNGGGPAPENVTIEQLQADIFDSCSGCHGGSNPSGQLSLTDAETSYNGLLDIDRRLVIAGDADASPLVHSVEGQDDNGNSVTKMPLGGSLSDEQIQLIRVWIDEGAKPPASVVNVTIEQLQDDIFGGSCQNCHNAGTADGKDFSSVESTVETLETRMTVNDGAGSRIVHILQGFDEDGEEVGPRMPQGGKLAAIDIAKVINWIDNGAEGPLEGPAAATFSDVQAIIGTPTCTGCHQSGTFSMEYENMNSPRVVAGDADASNLIQRLESGNMPPGPTRLSDDDIAVIRSWINDGAQNN